MVEDYQIAWWHGWCRFKYNFVDFQPSKCAGVQKWQIWGIRLWSNSIRMTQVESAEACQQLCQAREGCFFFTWVGPTTPVEFYRSTQGCVFQDLENNWTFHKKDKSPGRPVGWRKRKEALIPIPPAYRDQSPVPRILVVDRSCVKYKPGAQDIISYDSYAVWNMNLVSGKCGNPWDPRPPYTRLPIAEW